MQQELNRSFNVLSSQPTPAYFLSYEITEEELSVMRASFGTLTSKSASKSRTLDIDLRVGDHSLDNTHPIRSRFRFATRRPSRIEVPVSDVEALRSVLWFQTDKKYKDAVEQLTKVKTDVQVKVQEEDQAPDFSAEDPQQSVGETLSQEFDRATWEDRLKRYTEPFSSSSHVYSASAVLSVSTVTRWYVNSEGTAIRSAHPYSRLTVSAVTKAEDGMELPPLRVVFRLQP